MTRAEVLLFHKQFPQKINVWADIVFNSILCPFFTDALTSGIYLEFLRYNLFPELTAVYENEGDIGKPVWYVPRRCQFIL